MRIVVAESMTRLDDSQSERSEPNDPLATSKRIAGLVGPTLVIGAAAVLLNLGAWPAFVERAFRDPGLVFESGFPLFVAGLAIVRAHNQWMRGWPARGSVRKCAGTSAQRVTSAPFASNANTATFAAISA